MTRLPIVLLACVLPISGCVNGGYFDSSITRLDYSAKQDPASIQVSDAQLYKRENLINERREEQEYLADLLAKSRTVEFAPQLMRDLEMVSSLSVQLGLSFDSSSKLQLERASQLSDLEQQIAVTKLQTQLAQLRRDLDLLQQKLPDQTTPSGAAGTAVSSTALPKIVAPGLTDAKDIAVRLESLVKGLTDRLDKTSVAPRTAAAGVSPRELFQDRQAYRREIQSAINSTALDELHDVRGNSLFRLQFRAVVLPGSSDKELGVLQMQIQRPAFTTTELAPVLTGLYFEWLDHARLRLNEQTNEGKLRSDPTMLQLAAERKVFNVLELTVSNTPEPAAPKKADGQAGAAPKAKANAKGEPVTGDPKKMQAAQTDNKCEFGFFQYDADPAEDCVVVRVAFPPRFESDIARKAQVMTGGFSREWFKRTRGDFQKIKEARRSIEATPLPKELKQKCDGIFADPKSTVTQSYQEIRQIGESSDSLAQFQEGFTWAAQELGLNYPLAALRVTDAGIVLARVMDDAPNDVEAYRLLQSACGLNPDSTLTQRFLKRDAQVPDLFRDALFESDAKKEKWTARGRVSTYAVSPNVLAQRVSTVARAAEAVQIAASLAASLPSQGLGLSSGIGRMRSVAGKVDALERVPLVVGYSTPAARVKNKAVTEPAFGWLLGPRVVLDTENNALALEHNLEPYDLTADVSMPGWWPDVSIVTEAIWAPDWKKDPTVVISGPVEKSQRAISLPMRHSRSDLDGITTQILAREGNLRVPRPSISRVEPHEVSDCSSAATFLVHGSNIWRTSFAYLSGLQGRNVTVLPDMTGISVTFDIASLPPGSGFANLTVTTPDGPASIPVSVRGSRLVNNCAVAVKDPTALSITSVLPGTLYACDDKPRLLVTGKNFKPSDVTSAYLGTLEGDYSAINGDKALKVTFKTKIGTQGGKQMALPLILTTKDGVVSEDVAIERDGCSHPSSVTVSTVRNKN